MGIAPAQHPSPFGIGRGLTPIDRRISQVDPESLASRQLGVQDADRLEKLFIHRGIEDKRVRVIAPDFG